MLRIFIRNTTITAVLILITSGIFLSCSEECQIKPRSFAAIDFYSVVDGDDIKVPVDNFSLYGLGREDSLLYSGRDNINTISLPMNGSADESGFSFIFGEKIDTVWFTYEVIPRFLSQECGFVLNFELIETRHTSNKIDSVVIVIKEITSFDDTNIRIYH